MRVLVTGATGRVGRAIHVRLSREHDVVGLDRAPSSTADLIGDLCDSALIERALSGVDAVIHAAALHAPHVGLLPDSEFERINVNATRLLYEAARRHGVKHFVFTSTTALYGKAATPENAAGWVTEALQPQPKSIYHRTKLAAEDYLKNAAEQGGPPVTILRMSRCFPEPAPLMAAYRLHRGVDARDVASAHELALKPFNQPHRTYVISGATPFLPEDTAALLSDAPSVLKMRAPQLVEAFARRGWPLPASIDRVYVSARAEAELGWQPRYGFEEVLDMYDEEWAEVLPPKNYRSREE
jgi:nucleoside-diphosphate-sugar epimerase